MYTEFLKRCLRRLIQRRKGNADMNRSDRRESEDSFFRIAAACRAVFGNNWFYVACIELWGIYVHLPWLFPAALVRLPMYFYLPILFAFCYVVFFVIELGRRKSRAGEEGYGTDFAQEEESSVSRKDFMDGLAHALTSKLSWLIAALCAVPPYWLAEYYYDAYSFGIVVKGVVTLVSFAAAFAFLAYNKAKKM